MYGAAVPQIPQLKNSAQSGTLKPTFCVERATKLVAGKHGDQPGNADRDPSISE
jgi:hypothetical protein